MDITKIVIEGFEIKVIREKLDQIGAAYEKDDRTITLLENLLNFGRRSEDPFPVEGLREAQRIRSKVGGHTKGSEAQQILQRAISEHGSFADHFFHLCRRIAAELEAVGLKFEGERRDKCHSAGRK